MGTLNVTAYRVGTNASRGNPSAHRYSLILSGSSENGPATSAAIYFRPSPPADTVGYIAGNILFGLLGDGDFQAWYDILRQEKPVKVYYVESGTADILHIGVGTTPEGVGEGPRDPNA